MNHGVFTPGWEVIPVHLKPGQQSLQRHVYGEEARGPDCPYIDCVKAEKSNYTRTHGKDAKRENYLTPVRPIKPSEPPPAVGQYRSSSLWSTEYRSIFSRTSLDGSKYLRQDGPSYQAANPPECVSSSLGTSTCMAEYGLYGSNPRSKVKPTDTKMPVTLGPLTVGTVKGTSHIPGYCGFMPHNTLNPAVARIAAGEKTRSVDKTDILDCFHCRIYGYGGFVPVSPKNSLPSDLEPSFRTISSRDFRPPKGGVRGL